MTEKTKYNLLIGLPCYGGQVFNECVVGLIQLQKAVDAHNHDHPDGKIDFVVEFLANESLVTRARNTLVAKFLSEPSFTHLFFVDADIGFCGSDVLELLLADKKVIGGVYPKKHLDYDLLMTLQKLMPDQNTELYEIVSKRYAIELTGDNADNLLKDNSNIVEVKYLATGFMLIERSVFDTLKSKFPELQYDGYCENRDESLRDHYWLFFDTQVSTKHRNGNPVNRRYLSEDWAFSERCADAGITMYAHFGFGLNHMGFYKFRGHPGGIRVQHSVQRQLHDLIKKQEKNVAEENRSKAGKKSIKNSQ